MPAAERDADAPATRAVAGRIDAVRGAYPFVLDGDTKLPHMFVDIDDHDTAMRLLEIGVVVEVPGKPAQPGISADEPEPRAAETTEPTVTYHAVMFQTATRFDQHERGVDRRLVSACLGALPPPLSRARISARLIPVGNVYSRYRLSFAYR